MLTPKNVAGENAACSPIPSAKMCDYFSHDSSQSPAQYKDVVAAHAYHACLHIPRILVADARKQPHATEPPGP
jgi:hypothetical protein